MMERPRSSVRTSKIFKHILQCLKEKKHHHMLKWIGELEFEVTLKDRTNPSWTPHDNSLLEELDALFYKEHNKSTNNGSCSSRTRFNSRMMALCRNRLKETTIDSKSESSEKTIKKRTFKICSKDFGKELGLEACAGVPNSNIDSVETGPHLRENQIKAQAEDLNNFCSTSHFSCLFKCQDFHPGKSTNVILSQEIDKNKKTISYLIDPSINKVEAPFERNVNNSVTCQNLPFNQIEDIFLQGNENTYVYIAEVPLINKDMEVVTEEGNGNNIFSENKFLSCEEMDVVTEQENGNNISSEDKLCPCKETEVVTKQGNGNNIFSVDKFLSCKESEVVTERGNGNNISSEDIFLSCKETEVVTEGGNGNNISSDYKFLSCKETEVVTERGNGNNISNEGKFLSHKETEVFTAQGNGNNIFREDIFHAFKETEVVTERGNENNYVSNFTINEGGKALSIVKKEELLKNVIILNLSPLYQTVENLEIQCFDQNKNRIPLESMIQNRPILINPTIIINTGSTVTSKELTHNDPIVFLQSMVRKCVQGKQRWGDEYIRTLLHVVNRMNIYMPKERTFEKPERTFEKPERTFEKPERIFEKPERTFEKPMNLDYFNMDESTYLPECYEEFQEFCNIESL